MQYILTQQEYDDLKRKAELPRAWRPEFTKGQLQKKCTKICNEMPVTWGWGGPDPKPWKCMLTEEEAGREWFCDKCPVQDLCPFKEKEYSK